MGNSKSEPVRPSNEPQQRVRRPRLLHHEIKMLSEELESLCHTCMNHSRSHRDETSSEIRRLSVELESLCHKIRRLSVELESLHHKIRRLSVELESLHHSDEESDREEDRESRVRRPRLLHHDIRMLSEELESKCHQVTRLSVELESLCHSDEESDREEDRESLTDESDNSSKQPCFRQCELLDPVDEVEAPSLPVPEVRTSTRSMRFIERQRYRYHILRPWHFERQRFLLHPKIRRLSVELESLCHKIRRLSVELESLCHSLKKLSSSLELLPPHMSELRVVLLGNSWSERCSVGNFILGETKFNTEEEPDHCLRVSGERNTKQIIVINTTDHFMFHIRRCLELFDPGPHVFLLTLQPEDFTEEQKQRLCRDLQRFSEQSFDHSLILISTPRDESSGFMERYRQQPPLKDMIKKCKYRFLWRKDLDLPELLTRLGQVVKENNGQHVMPWWL